MLKRINETIVTECQIIANGFDDFFVSIGTELADHITSNVKAMRYVPNVANKSVMPIITSLEIMTIILKLNNQISPFLANDCFDSYFVLLTCIVNSTACHIFCILQK